MIDITVDPFQQIVEIEGVPYSYQRPKDVTTVIHQILETIIYSGERYILYEAMEDQKMKRLIKEW